MDLLASLGLADALPEQSTRLIHPGVVKSLDGEDDVRLGFNRCLHCCKRLILDDNDGLSKKPVSCKGCKRVKYCSTECRKSDSQSCREDEETGSAGHSPVVCSLLSLCNDDEDAEEELYSSNASKKKKTKDSGGGDANSSSGNSKKEAARYRVQTERESYPATLFNLLAESPNWFTEAMTRRLRYMQDVRSPTSEVKKRRGKRDRSAISPGKSSLDENDRKRELVLHIVGASVDSELWGWNGQWKHDNGKEDGGSDDDMPEVLTAYAEASTNLLSYLKNLLEVRECSVRLIFVGPDCPKTKTTTTCRAEVPIPDSKGSTLLMETYCCDYGSSKQPRIPPPDGIVFFNPGLTCTDYDWSKALSTACRYQSLSSGKGAGATTPFLITTNTEMEGFADVKCLLDGGYIDPKALPRDVLEAVDYPTTGDEDEVATFFFGENPYSGLRVRQSGTMGNDLYVKNRWIVGGVFCQGGGSNADAISSKKRKSGTGKNKPSNADGSDEDDGDDHASRKRHRGSKSKNTKKKNPALI